MKYDNILKEIKPKKEEINKCLKIANELIDFLNDSAKKEGINAEAFLVGSVAKETFLSGKSDIDIFISFPLDVSMDYLEEKGLLLGYKASDKFNGNSYKNYASHPYLISEIDGFKVDFVPCYKIDKGDNIKSAVDRTILHTNYIKTNKINKDEILLLKRFMSETKTYGSENKVGGFAGYLCELLILKYQTFENLLLSATNWKYGTSIDLEGYGTSKQFNDPLIVIDPTDKNRNVAASLRLDTYSEFINSARNYLESSDDIKLKYFYNLDKTLSINKLKNQFNDRGNTSYIISFKIPEIVHDALHPQLKKTLESICEKLEDNEFKVFKSDYWSDEENIAIFILEMEVFKLSNIKVHYGPKIFAKKACLNFQKIHGRENCYTLNDFLVKNTEREFKTCESYINHILTNEHSHKIKIGKNLKDSLLETYNISLLIDNMDEFNENKDFLIFLDDFLNPGQYQRR
ncbi:CCA tRNA nucleotidyltransferase [Methanobrevibacter sp. DSM 116169]|uniref:CCA tRNA nucleotidyltransferase n=1 Tax=Methanobrevibacter sp. DSM 116169 TaxID=3242727 RepID=UPI0038FD259E